MELRRLRHFLAVAETRSFTDAAVLLSISQPALSVSVRRLEDELGAELVDRTGRRIALTPSGERLVVEARRILDQAEALPRVITDPSLAMSGTVSLGIVQTMGPVALSQVLGRVRSRHPGIAFRVTQDSTSRMRAQLRSGELDLAFLYSATDADDTGHADDGDGPSRLDRGLVGTPLVTERLAIITPAGHPLAGRDEWVADELQGQQWVDLSRGTDVAAVLRSLVERFHLERDVVAEVSQLSLVTDLVRNGLGIALVPDPKPEPGIAIGQIAGRPLSRVLTLTHRRRALSAAAEVVAAELVPVQLGGSQRPRR